MRFLRPTDKYSISLRLVFGLGVLAVIAGTGIGALAWNRHREVLRSKPAMAATKKRHLGYEVVTIGRDGFQPQSITRAKGPFFLSVENRSLARLLTLQLSAEHGNRLLDVPQPDDQLEWIDELDLQPGSYVLTELNHPDWVCHLTITPQ
jgi:hypothetical protein